MCVIYVVCCARTALGSSIVCCERTALGSSIVLAVSLAHNDTRSNYSIVVVCHVIDLRQLHCMCVVTTGIVFSSTI